MVCTGPGARDLHLQEGSQDLVLARGQCLGCRGQRGRVEIDVGQPLEGSAIEQKRMVENKLFQVSLCKFFATWLCLQNHISLDLASRFGGNSSAAQ